MPISILSAHQPIPFLLYFFPLYLAAIWVLVCFVVSVMGGWRRLATSYSAPDPGPGLDPEIQQWKWISARFGWFTSYNNCLNFAADREGLRIKPVVFFRPFHPGLLIPWRDIRFERYRKWSFNFLELRFDKHPNIAVSVWPCFGEELVEARNRLSGLVGLSLDEIWAKNQ